jgi:hypothetical protein
MAQTATQGPPAPITETATTAAPDDSNQAIVVTGSRIRRADLVGVGPATVVTA